MMKDAGLIPVTIKSIRANGTGNISLQLTPQQRNDLLPEYSPGAHIDIFIPEIGPRQYSVCSKNSCREYYEICVKLEEKSTGGSHFIHHHLYPGDELMISSPRNHFTLPEAEKYIFMAGGIGITPLLVMAEEISGKQIDFELHYYVSTPEQRAFIRRLNAPELANNIFFHDSSANDSLRNTSPHCLLHPDKNTHVIACGPDGFILRLKELMNEYHWDPKQLSFEKFSAPAPKENNQQQAFYIQLESSGQRYLVGPHQTIAEVLLSVNADIMLSCEQGICGSCISDVTSGIPDHRDSVLTAEEKACNTQIAVCCSRSHSPVLVLDL